MGIRQDLSKVFSANVAVMVINVLNSFLLPMWLSIDNYALFRTFTLYVSFIGILHLGFVDGLNVKYGGLSIDKINRSEITSFHKFFILTQIAITIVTISVGLAIQNYIIVLLGVSIIPINLHSFSMLTYQAIGKFSQYSLGLILSALSTLMLYLIIHLYGGDDYRVFSLAYIGGFLIIVIFLEVYFHRQFGYSTQRLKTLDFNSIKNVYSLGTFVLLGNTIFLLFNTSGRWFVKLLMDNEAFAYYSFASTLLGFIILFINSVTLTLYPYLSKKSSNADQYKYRKIFIIAGSISLCGYYLVRIIVENFLPDYVQALPTTMILMASMPGLLIIKALYVNMYKVTRSVKQFLWDTLKYLLITLVLNTVLYVIFRTEQSIAVASVIAIYIWVFTPPKFMNLTRRSLIKEFVFLLVLLGSYFSINIFLDSLFLSGILMFILTIGINFTFFRKEIQSLGSKTQID